MKARTELVENVKNYSELRRRRCGSDPSHRRTEGSREASRRDCRMQKREGEHFRKSCKKGEKEKVDVKGEPQIFQFDKRLRLAKNILFFFQILSIKFNKCIFQNMNLKPIIYLQCSGSHYKGAGKV